MLFTMFVPQQIHFGQGMLAALPAQTAALGNRALVVASRTFAATKHMDVLSAQYAKLGVTMVLFTGVSGEPSPETVHAARDAARQGRCDVVVGIGGGSVLDTAKAAAAMAVNDGDVQPYLAGVGTGKALVNTPLPFIAVPTTAGSGSEATKNAVISDLAQGYKASLRSDSMMARVAIVDPALCLSLPAQATAYSGADALTQLLEAYITRMSQPMTDSLALGALPKAFASLAHAVEQPDDIQARTDMSYASLCSGICLANARLGAAHGIAAALGAQLGVAHGQACAVLLEPVLRVNLPHISEQKAAALCRAATGKQYDTAAANRQAVLETVQSLLRRIGIAPSLALGEPDQAKLAALEASVSASSMAGNPVELSGHQVRALITEVMR